MAAPMIQWRLVVRPARKWLVLTRWSFACEGWYSGHSTPAFTRADDRQFASEEKARIAGMEAVIELTERDARQGHRGRPFSL